jgi:hypothetical protein
MMTTTIAKSIELSDKPLDKSLSGLMENFERCSRRAEFWENANNLVMVATVGAAVTFTLLVVPMVPIVWWVSDRSGAADADLATAKIDLKYAIMKSEGQKLC